MAKYIYSFVFIVFLFKNSTVLSQVHNCQSSKISGVATPIYYSPENLRTNTFDILKYTINLDITDFVVEKMKGHTIIAPKLNSQSKISLDLLKMTIKT